MELWLDAVLIVLFALLIDRFIGELPNRFHLLRWIGNVVGWLDGKVTNRASRRTRVAGFVSYVIVFLLFWFILMSICAAVRYLCGDLSANIGTATIPVGEILWLFTVAFMFKLTFAIFSFRKHCKPIESDLSEGRTEDAASKVQMIVSRDTEGMDEAHIASSCCETISENLVDSVISPTFYFGLFGLTGAIMFRCANLMDAMWGYLNDKYSDLGRFVAKFDDALGYLTSRISPVFVIIGSSILRMNNKGIMDAAKNEHGKTPSPNSGWPMTATAAALEISMEKKDVYVMGTGPLSKVKDISRCYRLIEVTSIVFLLAVSLPIFALLGIHIQVFVEDKIAFLWGLLF
jgi:cobalamin biosynthesis protein CobD